MHSQPLGLNSEVLASAGIALLYIERVRSLAVLTIICLDVDGEANGGL